MRRTIWICQYCGEPSEDRTEHQDHVESFHYAEMLRNSELITDE